MVFGVFDFLKKTNENRSISSKKRFSFVFLRKSKTPQSHFEINWPLLNQQNWSLICACWNAGKDEGPCHFHIFLDMTILDQMATVTTLKSSWIRLNSFLAASDVAVLVKIAFLQRQCCLTFGHQMGSILGIQTSNFKLQSYK